MSSKNTNRIFKPKNYNPTITRQDLENKNWSHGGFTV